MNEIVVKKEDDFFEGALPSIMTGLLTIALIAAVVEILPVVQNADSYYTSQQFQGVNDPRTLNARHDLQWLSLSPQWVNAFIINRGPNEVLIGLNQSEEFFTIYPNETRTISRIGAEERIHTIFYHCSIGEIALVTITGTY